MFVGSTLVQLYMAWLQTVVLRNCNSLVCAHVKDISSTIRGMYTRLLENYPEKYWEGDEPPGFKPFEGSRNVRLISGRNCTVTIGTSENPDSVRGGDYSMAHLSEVAFWADTPTATPGDFIRAVCGSINSSAGTLVVLESTANGVGNYFHREWLRSEKGESDKVAVFVPWFEIEIYRRALDVAEEEFMSSLDPYEQWLASQGCTAEQINWYRNKLREYPDRRMMNAEYPSTATEAFTSSDANVFSAESVDRLRGGCQPPAAVGEISRIVSLGLGPLQGLRFVADSKGRLKVWSMPESSAIVDRYVVSVDIGGRSDKSDWSVIAVLDREPLYRGEKIEVVAQWRGHADHDVVARKAMEIAQFYNRALLVVESNTLETDNIGGDPSLSILNQMAEQYDNLYWRQNPIDGRELKVGFHTNRATKTLVIGCLITALRENLYVERDSDAADEMACYRYSRGTFAASDGNHDDILMTRAIGLHVAMSLPLMNTDESFRVKLISN